MTFAADFTLASALDSTVVVGAPAAKELLIDGRSLAITDDGGYFGSVPVALPAGTRRLELRLTPDEELPLRANVAFVRDLASYRRPEWIAVASGVGEAIRYQTTVVPGECTELTLTAWGSARLLVNDVEVGRQGGFMPYERPTPRVRRYDAAAVLRPGVENTIVVEVTRPTPILVDGLVISDHDWKATVDGSTVSTVRRRPWHRALADLHLTRRPHPLPAAAWLDGTDPTVVEPVTFAVPRPSPDRVEHLRFDLPPGTTRLEVDLVGEGVVTVDGEQLATGAGRVVADVPAGGKTGWLTLLTTPGHEAGAALTGPIRATVGAGRMPLGDWETHGLSEYSGGVRYTRRLVLPAAATLDLGRVRGTAEVLIDGISIGSRFCSPYTFDLTGVEPGGHTLTIEVFGTAAPYLDAVSPTHFIFPGQKTSGLFGPVTLSAR